MRYQGMTLAEFVGYHGSGDPRVDADVRREWRRTRPQGMKIQRATTATGPLHAMGRFFMVRGTIRGRMQNALKRMASLTVPQMRAQVKQQMALRRAQVAGALVLLVLSPALAEAVQLEICFDDASKGSAATIKAIVNGSTVLYPDILAGSVLSGTKRCSTKELPSSIQTGVDYTLTLKGVNSVNVEGPASNAATFRVPTAPPAPTGVTVQVVVP